MSQLYSGDVDSRPPIFLKKFDASVAKYYYVNYFSGEATWDVPAANASVVVPLHGEETHVGLPLRPIEESKEGGDDDRSENDERTRDVGIEIGDGDIVNFSKNARRALLERRNRARRISEARTRADAKAAEFSRWESLWERACVSGRNSCSVSISNGEENCGAAGGYLSDRFLRRYRAEFGRDLVSLSLVRHGLEKVPSGISSSCPSLRVLNLTCNRISSLDDDVTRLRHLEELRLSSNRLCEVPITIGRLGKVLKVLELGDNRLTSLQDFIGRLSEVRRLNVSGNSLLSLPSTLTDMSSLECMIASNNQITSLPVDIGDADTFKYHSCQKSYPPSSRIDRDVEVFGNTPSFL